MNILDYFDPYDKAHLEAYIQLRDTGIWPEGFVPEGTPFPPTWQTQLASMLADAWVDEF